MKKICVCDLVGMVEGEYAGGIETSRRQEEE